MKFRKKPVIIEAEQWLATKPSWDKIMEMGIKHTQWREGKMGSDSFYIFTLEGEHKATKGDWIIKGVEGEFYLCKPDIFEQTYEPVN